MSWQKKLRYRALRLLGFSLPLMLLSLLTASFIPRRPPQILAQGELSHEKKSSGRLVLPAIQDGEVPVTLTLQWDRRPPVALRMAFRMSDAEGQDQLQKKIKIKAKGSAGSWEQTLLLQLPGNAVRNFTLAHDSREATLTRYQFTAFASTPVHRILRIGEVLFYPALAIVFLALVMVLFPSFVPS